MNKEVQKIWVSMLRSGEFKQGKGRLRNHNDEYCCLGLLCEAHARATGGKWTFDEETNEWYYADENMILLPEDVQDWAQLSSGNPSVRFDELVTSLAALNDGAALNDDTRADALTFLQIADLIETQL